MRLITTIAAATLAVSLLAPAPAQAETHRVADARGDLDHGADIWRVRLNHADVIRVRVKHDDLRRHPRRGAGISVFLDTDPTSAGPEYVLGSGLMDGTDYLLSRTDGWRAAKPVSCRYGLRLDYVNDVSRMWFGRGCFRDPDVLRVAVKVGAEGRAGGPAVNDWMATRRGFTPWAAQG